MTAVTKKTYSGSGLRSLVLGYAWPAVLAVAVLGVTVAMLIGITSRPGESAGSTPIPAASPDTTASHAVAAPAAPRCPPGMSGKQIVVGLAAQQMVLCLNGAPVSDIKVTTGSVDRGAGTPLGRWKIESHDTDRTLNGPGYTVFVHYWLHIVGDIGLHDSSWQKFPYGDLTKYRTQGSQGCIHVPPDAMKRLYAWADDGTPIDITA